jgi:hypothetical protein
MMPDILNLDVLRASCFVLLQCIAAHIIALEEDEDAKSIIFLTQSF